MDSPSTPPAKSDATRQTVLNAAVDVFGTMGYAAATVDDIVDRSDLTKPAFYCHFDSKESVASAIMEESSATLLSCFRATNQSDSPALANTIDGVVAVGEIVAVDTLARTGAQLTRILAGSNRVASRIRQAWVTEITGQVRLASCEGDLRRDLEPEVVAELIMCTMLGALTRSGSSHGDERQRFSQTCEILLAAVASEESLSRYQEFLADKALLTLQPSPSME